MLKAHEQLVQVTSSYKRIGNHAVNALNDSVRSFWYHMTPIVTVNDEDKMFSVDNGGWNTVSTARAIRSLTGYFLARGYREVGRVTLLLGRVDAYTK